MSNFWTIYDFFYKKNVLYEKYLEYIQKFLLNSENNDNTKLQLHVNLLFYFLICFVIKENDAVMYNLQKL